MYRKVHSELQVLLVHPGGPIWKNKDEGAWTIPKGELNQDENELDAAKREFFEETGFEPCEPFVPLGVIRQKSGKLVHAWAFEGNCDPSAIRSNAFEMDWPPKSGRVQSFPEIDRAEFFTIKQALIKMNPAQIPLLNELMRILSSSLG